MKLLLLLAFALPAVQGKLLLRTLTTEGRQVIEKCHDNFFLSCEKVALDLDALVQEERVTLPSGLQLTRTHVAASFDGSSVSYTFGNEEEGAQAVFVRGKAGDKEYVAGSLNWAGAGRHFKLEMCASSLDCFTWSEVNPKRWINEGSVKAPPTSSPLSRADQELLERGMADNTTNVNVSITIYTSETFRNSFSDYNQMLAFVNLAISETNQGYANSQVPITMFLKCLLDSPSTDAPDSFTILDNFWSAAKGDFNSFRHSADVTLLLSNTYSDNCGVAYTDVLGNGQTLGTVAKGCATGYYSFGHEIAHMVGALHNREAGSVNSKYPTGYGYLMRPPVNSGYRTILAYGARGYYNRVNYYSNPNVSFNNVPTGDANNNNAKVLTERRFLMANVGDESMSCSFAG